MVIGRTFHYYSPNKNLTARIIIFIFLYHRLFCRHKCHVFALFCRQTKGVGHWTPIYAPTEASKHLLITRMMRQTVAAGRLGRFVHWCGSSTSKANNNFLFRTRPRRSLVVDAADVFANYIVTTKAATPQTLPTTMIRTLSTNSDSQNHKRFKTNHKVPPDQVPALWRQAQAVCFDVDCTVTKQDALDDLAAFLGKGAEVEALTAAAMDGTLDLAQALQQRLEIMEPTVEKLQAYIQSNPAQERLVPGIAELIRELQARNIAIFFISGGFRELILPVADLLGVPRANIYANRFVYMADDADPTHTQLAIRVRGFDPKEPTSQQGGKPEAIRQIRARHPFQTIVMIGDGVTDLEAVQETGGADLFIGSGVVVSRPAVQQGADWFVTDYQELIQALARYKVAMIGSGAFASAVMQMVAHNARQSAIFENQINMWVHEEDYQGQPLTKIMNQQHENPKYLPGVNWGDNVTAKSDLVATVRDADLLIFCAPHQYLHTLCKQIQLLVKPTAIAISLTKGIHIGPDGAQLLSDMIRRMLKIECSVLMGANLADEIKPGNLCEATIASHVAEHGHVFSRLFETSYFHVNVVHDVEGAELAGALKNIVALATGFCDGSGLGQNAKAALMRQGLAEMRRFAQANYATVRDDTFMEACGVADLIATCYGGRNHRVAEEYARLQGTESFEALEERMLNGQKLQGVLTSYEVQVVLESNGWQKDYPLFTAVHAIVSGDAQPKDIVRYRELAAQTASAAASKQTLSRGEKLSFLEKTIGV